MVILSLNAVFDQLNNLDLSWAPRMFSAEPPLGGSRAPAILLPTGFLFFVEVCLCPCSCTRSCAAQRGCVVVVTPPRWQRAAGQCQPRATSLESDVGPPASCCGPHNGDIMWGSRGGEMGSKRPKEVPPGGVLNEDLKKCGVKNVLLKVCSSNLSKNKRAI